MRRSAAPSQLGAASKRARFTPPFANKPAVSSTVLPKHVPTNNPGLSKNNEVLSPVENNLMGTSPVGSKKVNLSVRHGSKSFVSPVNKTVPDRVLQTTKSNDEEKKDEGIHDTLGVARVEKPVSSVDDRRTSFHSPSSSSSRESQSSNKSTVVTGSTNTIPLVKKAPSLHRTFRLPTLANKDQIGNQQDLKNRPGQDNSSEDDAKSHYYNVMWCKLSKKKHKKWEGDAILVTKTRSVSLLDMEGKEIGKGRGYKIKDLESMSEGQTLMIGGKEIEVMGEISEADWTSGKCFQGAAAVNAVSDSSAKVPTPASKPFLNPLKGKTNHSREIPLSDRSIAKPIFDPSAPDALVMPRPSSTHQWEHNTNKQNIVDVVVDPYLASKLRPHQKEGVRFLYECIMGMRAFQGNGAILADDMGLGKTLQCITLLWTLYKQGPYGGKPLLRRVIVITPGSLVKNWCREFRKWLGNERIKTFDVGSDSKVEEFIKSPIYPVMVISYEMFVRSITEIQKIKFDLVICDEGHRLKNTNIKTTSLIMGLPTRRRILLTGTPVQNDLQEFFSIVEFCNPGVLGSSGAFHRVYEDPILKSRQPGATQEERDLGETRAIELSRLTSLFVLRRTQEINNKYLPPKVETVVFCRPTPLQLSLYHKLISSRIIRRCLTNSSYSKECSPHLVCIAALKKLCNHPCLIYKACVDAKEEQDGEEMKSDRDQYMAELYGEDVSLYKDLLPLYPADFTPDVINTDHSGKLQVLARLLQAMHAGEVNERSVLVSNYTQTLDVLQKLCKTQGYRYCRLDGSTPTSKRQHIVEQFNSKYSQQSVFLLSSKAGGVGLNLVGASHLVLYDIDWNPANDLQAMARVWRDGQKKTVNIYRLIMAGTLEEKVYQRQISKQGLSGVIMDAKTGSTPGNVKFSLEDLRDLFTLHEGASCITHDLLDCDCQGDKDTEQKQEQLNTSSRSCQLGSVQKAKKKKKNLSMDELMEWKHFAGPLDENFPDGFLATARDYITYVFQNITNKSVNPKTV